MLWSLSESLEQAAVPYVVSSAVSRIEFASGTMDVWFVESGGPYTYFGVPEQVYRAFLAASSKGRFFNDHIKDRYGR